MTIPAQIYKRGDIMQDLSKVSVVLPSLDPDEKLVAVVDGLLEYGFSAYPARRIVERGTVYEKRAVEGGTLPSVSLVTAKSFSYPLREGEEVETAVELSAPLKAPVAAGGLAGEVVFTLDGREVGRVGLFFGETIAPEVSSALKVLKMTA